MGDAKQEKRDLAHDTNSGEHEESIIELTRIVHNQNLVFFFSLLVVIIVFLFYIDPLMDLRKVNETNTNSIICLQKRIDSLTETDIQLVFELEQLSKFQSADDRIVSGKEIWQHKLDSIERRSFYNSLTNRMDVLNEAAMSKALEDNQKMYDDYLTHVNSIIAFFSIMVALISIAVPLLINRKLDGIIKEHEKQLKGHDEKQQELSDELNTNVGNVNTIVENMITTISKHDEKLQRYDEKQRELSDDLNDKVGSVNKAISELDKKQLDLINSIQEVTGSYNSLKEEFTGIKEKQEEIMKKVSEDSNTTSDVNESNSIGDENASDIIENDNTFSNNMVEEDKVLGSNDNISNNNVGEMDGTAADVQKVTEKDDALSTDED